MLLIVSSYPSKYGTYIEMLQKEIGKKNLQVHMHICSYYQSCNYPSFTHEEPVISFSFLSIIRSHILLLFDKGT